MRRRLSWIGVALALALMAPFSVALGSAVAHAQPAQSGQPSRAPGSSDPETTAEAEARALADGDPLESPELRALRLAELELFGRSQARVTTSSGPHVRVGGLPSSMRSSPAHESVPGRTVGEARAAHGLPESHAWLRDLRLPDLPIRWDERVIRFLTYFRDDPRGQNMIRAWMRRVNRYGPTIRQTLRAQNLPEDLLYVAMVESGFTTHARSHASAVGMWQFVRPTGEAFGLHVDHWVDLRQDPERSTEAAARYLGQLHRRFGTWELALASYNMGYGALLRSIRKYNTNDYWRLSHLEAALPFETTIYVPKILACAIVGRNPERFGLENLTYEDPIRWDTVDVPGGSSLSTLARAAETTVEELRHLNPELRRNRVPPGALWSLRIPHGSTERFAERWARAQPRHPAYVTHRVRFGEDLEDIARERGAEVSRIRELNEMEEGARAEVGVTLLVPTGRPTRSGRSGRSGSGRAEEDRPVVAVPDMEIRLPGRRRVFYRVSSHDSVDEIARFFELTVDEIRRWNRIEPSAALHSGMYLQLFVAERFDLGRAVVLTPDDCRVLVVGSEEFFDYHEGQSGRVRFRYTVRSGDTLSEIAQRFGASTSTLARVNQISRRSILSVGQDLVVYAPRDRVPEGALRQPEAARAEGTGSEGEQDDQASSEASAEVEAETHPEEGDESDEAEESDEADEADEADAEEDSASTEDDDEGSSEGGEDEENSAGE